MPKPKGYGGARYYYEFLQTVKPQGQRGEAFAYKTVNTDTLGWMLQPRAPSARPCRGLRIFAVRLTSTE